MPMRRYTGRENLQAVLARGVAEHRVVLETDGGQLVFRPTVTDGPIVAGRTEDDKVVTVDWRFPNDITVI